MPSPTQYAANRLNAEKSRGATSPEGKARSSMNALRHGLTARVVVLLSEDMDAYKKISLEMVDSLDAQTSLERQLAQPVVDNQWRINRIRSIEDGMLGMGHFEAAGDIDCPNCEIHAAMTAARAFRLLKTEQMKGLPHEPEAPIKGIGVVLASAQITAESARRDRLRDSLLAEKANFNLAIYNALERPVAPSILSTAGFASEDSNQPGSDQSIAA